MAGKIRTLGPGIFKITDTANGRDFSEDGLAVWLFDHKGETLPAQFVPNTKGNIQWTFNVTIAPIAIGGDVKSKNTNNLSFAVTNVAHTAYSGK